MAKLKKTWREKLQESRDMPKERRTSLLTGGL
jgi:hypothetical protein